MGLCATEKIINYQQQQNDEHDDERDDGKARAVRQAHCKAGKQAEFEGERQGRQLGTWCVAFGFNLKQKHRYRPRVPPLL